MLQHLRSRIRTLWYWKRKRSDLEDEIRFHLEAEEEERREAGASTAAARRASRLDFGNIGVVAEDTRAMWGWAWCGELAQDIRYAVRTLSKSAAFTAAAVISLALGIGANTLLYSFTDAILLRALPVADPDQLVRMTWHAPKSEFHGSSYHDSSFKVPEAGYTDGIFAFAAFELFQAHDEIFSGVIAYQSTGPITLTIHEQAMPATGEYVSGDYFRVLGVVPAAGRWLRPGDDSIGAPPVAVVSRTMADTRLGGPNGAVGQTVLINNIPVVIVGVAPRGFQGTDPGAFPDLFVPLHSSLMLQSESGHQPIELFNDPNEVWLEVMARLRPDVSLDRAQAALAPPYHLFTEHVRTLGTWKQAPELVLVDGARGIDGVRRAYATPLALLTGLSGLILFLACSNIANLLLSRSAARGREIAVRVSLGASRGRVIRQLLTESVVLACVGGLLGVGIAAFGAPIVTSLLGDGQSNFTLHAELNWRVLSFACGLSVLTGLVFGALPR
jgi:macrolide transport system ATP-binding/permease protein